MEGNVELPSGEGQNMFGFWKNRLTDVLIGSVKADDGILIHLATEEYQHLFDWQRVRKEIRVIQPLFYVRKRVLRDFVLVSTNPSLHRRTVLRS